MKFFHSKIGVSLIEFILYVAIAAIALISIVSFSWQVLQLEPPMEARTELVQNSRFVLEKMTASLRQAEGIKAEVPQQGPQTLTLRPTGDAWIRQDTPRENHGKDLDLHEYPWSPSSSQRSLIRFDLSALPQGAVITAANLKLRELTTYGRSTTIAVHRLTQDWTETGVTWAKTNGSANWQSAGGDFNPTPTAQNLISWDPNTFPKSDTWDLLSDVRDFGAGKAMNYGWLLKANPEDNSQYYWTFHSKENTVPPELEVTYTLEGSVFGVNPGVLSLDSEGVDDDIVFDTYMIATLRKLRMRRGLGASLDLTSNAVNVTEFLLKKFIRENGTPSIQIQLTLEDLSGNESIHLQGSTSLRTP